MAVEDGAILGLLFGLLDTRLKQSGRRVPQATETLVPSILEIYERLRKHRTTVNVRGAVQARWFNHLPDGPEQEKRDIELSRVDWSVPRASPYIWCDATYQKELLAHDLLGEARSTFETWWNAPLTSDRSRL